MNNAKFYCGIYLSIFILVIMFDRITKIMVLHAFSWATPLVSFFSRNVVLNRGIAGGLCSSSNHVIFISVSLLVMAIYCFLGTYTFYRYKGNKLVLGEILVLSGGFSNIIDRFLYQGVIDFIAISYNGWMWPVFNIADAAIVMGVGVMVTLSFFEL
jgi:signal peptidase II